jgi:hypothetical protein
MLVVLVLEGWGVVWSRCKQHWVCHPKDTVGHFVGFAGRRALHSISSELVQHCKRAWAVLCGTCHFGPVSNILVCTMACVLPLQGQVYAMAFANNTLFSAGQDTTIRVWALNEQAGIFVSQVCTAVQGAGWLGTAAGGWHSSRRHRWQARIIASRRQASPHHFASELV